MYVLPYLLTQLQPVFLEAALQLEVTQVVSLTTFLPCLSLFFPNSLCGPALWLRCDLLKSVGPPCTPRAQHSAALELM